MPDSEVLASVRAHAHELSGSRISTETRGILLALDHAPTAVEGDSSNKSDRTAKMEALRNADNTVFSSPVDWVRAANLLKSRAKTNEFWETSTELVDRARTALIPSTPNATAEAAATFKLWDLATKQENETRRLEALLVISDLWDAPQTLQSRLGSTLLRIRRGDPHSALFEEETKSTGAQAIGPTK